MEFAVNRVSGDSICDFHRFKHFSPYADIAIHSRAIPVSRRDTDGERYADAKRRDPVTNVFVSRLGGNLEDRGAHARFAFIAPLIANVATTIFTANYIPAHSILPPPPLFLSRLFKHVHTRSSCFIRAYAEFAGIARLHIRKTEAPRKSQHLKSTRHFHIDSAAESGSSTRSRRRDPFIRDEKRRSLPRHRSRALDRKSVPIKARASSLRRVRDRPVEIRASQRASW